MNDKIELPKKEELWTKFRKRTRRNFNALSQVVNCWFLFGYEDESCSSRFYRWSRKDGKLCKIPAFIVDSLFFWDTLKDGDKILRHCEKSYLNEVARSGVPFDLRKGA